MATIRKIGLRWQAQVRKTGFKSITKSFQSKVDAQRWSLMTESKIEQRQFVDTSNASKLSLSDLIGRYKTEIAPTKRSGLKLESQLNILNRSTLAKIACANITPADIAVFRDARLRQNVSPQTVGKNLALLHRLFVVLEKQWQIRLPNGNPATLVAKPTIPAGAGKRDRRLEKGERELLLSALKQNPVMQDIVNIACETAMRRGEIVNIKAEDVDLNKRVLHIPLTKTNIPRTIPLSALATSILTERIKATDRPSDQLFPIMAGSVSQAFNRACKRSQKLHNLRFHDLRHEATSQLFEKGLTPMQVATVTGHRDFQMLHRYTHLRAEDMVALI